MQVTHRTTSPLSSHHLSRRTSFTVHQSPPHQSPPAPLTTHHLTSSLHTSEVRCCTCPGASWQKLSPRASSARYVRLLYLDAAAPSMAYGATCGALSEALFAEALAGGAAAAVLGTAASTAFCMSSGTAR